MFDIHLLDKHLISIGNHISSQLFRNYFTIYHSFELFKANLCKNFPQQFNIEDNV